MVEAKLFTIPSDYPFLESFARGVLARYSFDALGDVKILLPTRRSCRNLRNAFLRITEGKPFILPQLIPVGDLDEDELKLTAMALGRAEDVLQIKPAISPLRRRLLLAQLIERMPDHKGAPEQAVALADSLANLIDMVHNEQLSFDALKNLVEAEFSAHWQVTLDFLEIIRVHWPKILESEGTIDPADRRNRLIQLLITIWQESPPNAPILAAGISGSLPATAALLKAVLDLPNGEVILPGFDLQIDQESWDNLEDTHPQAVFKQLLGRMGCDFSDVFLWPDLSDMLPSNFSDRMKLAQEMMRPAATCGEWAHMQPVTQKCIENALGGVQTISSKTEQEEAEKIALLLRETLETLQKTAIVVTPDRALARRIGAVMRRWGIELDDSAGTPMHYTRIGSWLQTAALFLIEDLRPLPFLNFMHHQLAACGHEDHYIAALASIFDKEIMRGASPSSGFDGLYSRIDSLCLPEDISKNTKSFLSHLENLVAPFYDLVKSGKHDFITWLDAHIEIAEALAAQPDKTGAERLWSSEDGEAIALFLSDLKRQAHSLPPMRGESYFAILVQLMRTGSVRPLYGTHPRLQVLGQLEARMIHADVMILAGLNEGVWPTDPGHDPWMSRPMRHDFGLPSLDQAIGQAAHDFVGCFAAPELYLSRADRQGGAPAVTSRWLLRLNAVLQSVGRSVEELENTELSLWHEALMDSGETTEPYKRPAPKPPISARPKGLAVTSIGKWMRDPYHIYARYILRLKKLKAIEEEASSMDQGQFLHAVLEKFVDEHRDVMPGDARRIIGDIASELRTTLPEAQNIPAFWWPRLERGLDWFIEEEEKRRKIGMRPWKIESEGRIDWHGFSLSAKADRIDSTPTNEKIIIDYKSGTVPLPSDMRAGYDPQLALEALLVNHSGFGTSSETQDVQFWKITGGSERGKVTGFEKSLQDLIAEAEEGLTKLIKAFESPDTPYFSLPNPKAAPNKEWQDYAHLARVAEWEFNDSEQEVYNVAAE